MLGYSYRDQWSAHRIEHGKLDPQWFFSEPQWMHEHIDNLNNTFHIGVVDGDEQREWVPLDVWPWAPEVVMFGGLWRINNKHGNTVAVFDAIYLSTPKGIDPLQATNALVLLDDLEIGAPVPTWYAHPLNRGVCPLWWKTNKDLAWASKLITLIATKTDRLLWQACPSFEHIKESIPMFERAWQTMPTQEQLTSPRIPALPTPSWAVGEQTD